MSRFVLFLDVLLVRFKSNSQPTTHPNLPNPSTPHPTTTPPAQPPTHNTQPILEKARKLLNGDSGRPLCVFLDTSLCCASEFVHCGWVGRVGRRWAVVGGGRVGGRRRVRVLSC